MGGLGEKGKGKRGRGLSVAGASGGESPGSAGRSELGASGSADISGPAAPLRPTPLPPTYAQALRAERNALEAAFRRSIQKIEEKLKVTSEDDTLLRNYSKALQDLRDIVLDTEDQVLADRISAVLLTSADYMSFLDEKIRELSNTLQDHEERWMATTTLQDWVKYFEEGILQRIYKNKDFDQVMAFLEYERDEGWKQAHKRFGIDAVFDEWKSCSEHQKVLQVLHSFGFTSNDWDACNQFRKQGNFMIHGIGLKKLDHESFTLVYNKNLRELETSRCLSGETKQLLKSILNWGNKERQLG